MKVWILLLVCGLAVASAVRYEDVDIDDLDDVDPTDPSTGKTLVERLREGMKRALERIQNRLEKNKLIAAEFGDRIKELVKKVAEIGKELNQKNFAMIRELNSKIRSLARDVFKRLTGSRSVEKRASVAQELHELFVQIRDQMMTSEGLKEVKDHISRMRTSHPALQMVKSYVEAADNEHLKEILRELFSGLKGYYKARYETTLERLFKRVAILIRTDEGFDVLYNYFLNLESNHPLVSRLHSLFLITDKDDIREILEELISAFEH